MVKSRNMRWGGHVARMEEKRNAYGIFIEEQKERDHEEDIGAGGRIILTGCSGKN
jgi:hypothetical protein